MKKLFFISFLVLMTGILKAQTVENIQVEQDGEKLNIHYRIGGSTSEQLYFVTLTGSIDNGPAFEPKNVIGDVGTNIRGGKSFNTIVWDVFKDVDEIGSIEFFVKVDLESDESKKNNVDESPSLNDNMDIPSKNQIQTINGIPVSEIEEKSIENARKVFVSYSGSIGGWWDDESFYWWDKSRPIGFRVGYLGKWGGYVTARAGWDWDYNVIGWSALAGVTKHIYGNGDYRFHGYLGAGVGDYGDEINIEFGLIGVVFDRFTLDVGLEFPAYFAAVTFGAGILF